MSDILGQAEAQLRDICSPFTKVNLEGHHRV